MPHQKARVRVFLHQAVQEKQLSLLQRQEKALDKPWQKLDLVVPRFSLVPVCRYGNELRRSSELEQCSQEDARLSSLMRVEEILLQFGVLERLQRLQNC